MTRTSLPAHAWKLLALLVAAILSLPLVAPTPAGTQEAPASALAVQYFNAVEGGDRAFLISDDALLHSPEGTYTGTDGPSQFGDVLGASFSNVKFWLQSVAQASNGYLIATFTLTGINTGPYHGLTANCAGVAVPGVALLRVEERSVITESWAADPGDDRRDLPAVQQVSLVTEQWINYDADTIASQIVAFSEIDPANRPGCDTGSPTNDQPLPDVAPRCGRPADCGRAY